jgi:hypothetical protein
MRQAFGAVSHQLALRGIGDARLETLSSTAAFPRPTSVAARPAALRPHFKEQVSLLIAGASIVATVFALLGMLDILRSGATDALGVGGARAPGLWAWVSVSFLLLFAARGRWSARVSLLVVASATAGTCLAVMAGGVVPFWCVPLFGVAVLALFKLLGLLRYAVLSRPLTSAGVGDSPSRATLVGRVEFALLGLLAGVGILWVFGWDPSGRRVLMPAGLGLAIVLSLTVRRLVGYDASPTTFHRPPLKPYREDLFAALAIAVIIPFVIGAGAVYVRWVATRPALASASSVIPVRVLEVSADPERIAASEQAVIPPGSRPKSQVLVLGVVDSETVRQEEYVKRLSASIVARLRQTAAFLALPAEERATAEAAVSAILFGSISEVVPADGRVEILVDRSLEPVVGRSIAVEPSLFADDIMSRVPCTRFAR